MSYSEALTAAGYEVKAIEYFGSYQGDWLAATDKGIIHGWFGSCSHCDAFEAEFGWSPDDLKDSDPDAFNRKMAQFGASYYPLTPDELTALLARLNEDRIWDTDAPGMLRFLQEHGAVTLL